MALHNPAGQCRAGQLFRKTQEKNFLRGSRMEEQEGQQKQACWRPVTPFLLSLHPLVLAWMLLEGCLRTSLSQMQGEDHISEQQQGRQSD